MSDSGTPPLIDPNSLGFLVTDVARLWRAVLEREIGAGALPVTAAEARVLANIARLGPVRQSRLAGVMGVAPMSLTGFLDRLEGAGMITRETDPEDRRAKIVTLTDAAQPVLTQLSTLAGRARARATAGLSEAQLDAFNTVALHLRASLTEMRCAPQDAAGKEQDT